MQNNMNKQEIIETTNRIIAEEFEKEITDFIPEADIKETLELDSLAIVDMVALLEGEFGVKISGKEIVEVKTFGKLYDFLGEKIAQA